MGTAVGALAQLSRGMVEAVMKACPCLRMSVLLVGLGSAEPDKRFAFSLASRMMSRRGVELFWTTTHPS